MKIKIMPSGAEFSGLVDLYMQQGTDYFRLAGCLKYEDAERYAAKFRKALAAHDEEVLGKQSAHIGRLQTENDCLRKENSNYQQKVGDLKTELQTERTRAGHEGPCAARRR